MDREFSRLAAAMAMAVVGALAVAATIAILVFQRENRTAQQVEQHRHGVTATTVGPAQDDGAGTGGARAHTPATWNHPMTGPGSGLITVPVGTAPGTAVPLLVDDHGRPAAPAKSPQAITADAVGVGLGSLTGISVVAAGGYVIRRRVLEDRAELGWEPEWEQVEPLWSGRR
ncbi:hypothetical protein PUR56_40895 [Streptomyces sp. BE303]|nr:hypothetical protein [Streptomyces sp. BE303]MED7955077.1 hypothetical protein [Streptomyces sp. BE303]